MAVASVFVVRGGRGRWKRRGRRTEEEKGALTGSGVVGGRLSLVVWAKRKWLTCARLWVVDRCRWWLWWVWWM